MADVAFPEGLPPLEDADMFSADEEGDEIRSSMDSGPDKVRLRSRAAPIQVTYGHSTYTSAQLSTIRNFYRNVAGFGSKRFTMTDPITGVVEEYRFQRGGLSYRPNPKASHLYTVTVNLEQFP